MIATTNQRSVQTARRRFFEDGHAPHGLVSETILRSWQRCSGMGLDAATAPHIEPLDKRALHEIRQRNEQLHRTCRPELESLYAEARDTDSIVILTDAQGMVLDTLGSAGFVSQAARVALRPGVMWQEATTGTNAIGTALAERRAVEVRGGEHFFEPHRILSCYAAPILDPQGQMIGALDLSGRASMAHTHALGMVRLAVDHIEHRFFDQIPTGCEVLRLHSDVELLGTAREGVLVFRDRCLIAANRFGLTLLGLDCSALGKQHFDEFFITRPASLASATQLALLDGRTLQVRGQAERTPITARRPVDRAVAVDQPISDRHLNQAQQQAARMLDADIPVLILGETGVGKEVFARRVHQLSNWSSGPFLAVNCAALPASLIESELFGYEAGAFTGARRQGSPGLLRQANGGVLLLDEIGDMPLELQSRLLRVLQDREVAPLGGTRPVPVRFALICSTHRSLRTLVDQGLFRADLYYRIAHHTVTLPALRLHDDLNTLIMELWQQLHGDAAMSLPHPVLARLCAYTWPGNYRQLVGVLRMLQVLARQVRALSLNDLPAEIRDTPASASQATSGNTLDHLARDAMCSTLAACGGNVSAAARRLGVSRSTLYRRALATKPAS